LTLCRRDFAFSEALKVKIKDTKLLTNVQTYFRVSDPHRIMQSFEKNKGTLKITIDQQTVELELGKDVFSCAADAFASNTNNSNKNN